MIMLMQLAQVLNAQGYDVVYVLKDGTLALPQCVVSMENGFIWINTGTMQTKCLTVVEAVDIIDKLPKFLKVRITAECETTLLVKPNMTPKELIEACPDFDIDFSTLKILSQELTNGLHGT